MKLVCISDTHNQHDSVVLPEGDILVHAGDFTNRGLPGEVRDFLVWLEDAGRSYRQVVLCAGNHDFLFEKSPAAARQMVREIAPNVTYLEDEAAEIEGLLWYASPRTPWFYNWAFNVHRGGPIRAWWERIPQNTNLLVTHGPPFGIGDQVTPAGVHLGCEELRERLSHLPDLRAHIFGHIHGGYSTTVLDGVGYINASICDEEYRPVHAPIVLEIQKPVTE